MIKIKWIDPKPKRIEIKEEGVSATLHLFENGELSFDNKIWKVIKKKLADDIICERLIVMSETDNNKNKDKEKDKDKDKDKKETRKAAKTNIMDLIDE